MQWTTAAKEISNLADKFSQEGFVLLGRVLTDESLAEARIQIAGWTAIDVFAKKIAKHRHSDLRGGVFHGLGSVCD